MARTRVIFRPDKKGVASIAVSTPVQLAVHKVAGEGMVFAMSISPVETGEYLGAFELVNNRVRIAAMLRAGTMLMNTADHAAAVEWGNQATKGVGHGVLTKTLAYLYSRVRLTK